MIREVNFIFSLPTAGQEFAAAEPARPLRARGAAQEPGGLGTHSPAPHRPFLSARLPRCRAGPASHRFPRGKGTEERNKRVPRQRGAPGPEQLSWVQPRPGLSLPPPPTFSVASPGSSTAGPTTPRPSQRSLTIPPVPGHGPAAPPRHPGGPAPAPLPVGRRACRSRR